MASVLDTQSAGRAILRDRTTIANAFVQLYTRGHEGRSPRRQVSQVSFQLALDTVQRLGQALLDGCETIEAPPLRGARAALRGKHMAQSLDWIGHLERLVTNFLYADAGLQTAEAKAGVLRLAVLFDAIYRQELDAYRKVQEQLSGWQSRVSTGLVTYLLSGAPIETASLGEQARMLGIDPDQPPSDPARSISEAHRSAPPPPRSPPPRPDHLDRIVKDRPGGILHVVFVNAIEDGGPPSDVFESHSGRPRARGGRSRPRAGRSPSSCWPCRSGRGREPPASPAA